jgi:hypothetical protein
MGTGLRIGIDFDNTLINYDDVFFAMAKRSGLIGSGVPSRKRDVRDAIRKLPDGELTWQRLQGQVYGKGIAEAAMAALDWMTAQGLFDGDHGISLGNVYFESTRAEKLGRIAVLGLTHFIDDLKEVLADPDFPPNVERILFDDEVQPQAASCITCSTWSEIEKQVFGRSNF